MKQSDQIVWKSNWGFEYHKNNAFKDLEAISPKGIANPKPQKQEVQNITVYKLKLKQSDQTVCKSNQGFESHKNNGFKDLEAISLKAKANP